MADTVSPPPRGLGDGAGRTVGFAVRVRLERLLPHPRLVFLSVLLVGRLEGKEGAGRVMPPSKLAGRRTATKADVARPAAKILTKNLSLENYITIPIEHHHQSTFPGWECNNRTEGGKSHSQ